MNANNALMITDDIQDKDSSSRTPQQDKLLQLGRTTLLDTYLRAYREFYKKINTRSTRIYTMYTVCSLHKQECKKTFKVGKYWRYKVNMRFSLF